jgi:hypothetical protein
VNNLKPKKHHTWLESHATFDVQDEAKVSSKRAELNSMRMKETKSVEHYTLRHQRARHEALIPDDDATAFNFIQTLLPYLYDAVFNAEMTLSKHEKNRIDKSAPASRAVEATNGHQSQSSQQPPQQA